MYILGVTSDMDQIWDIPAFIKYLSTNQHKSIGIDILPEALCMRHLKVYDILDCFEFASVAIHTWNPLEYHPKYKILYKKKNFWFGRQSAVTEYQCEYTGAKTFFCMYHRPTAARLGLAGYLHNKYAEISLIHFSADTSDNSIDQFEFNKLSTWSTSSLTHAVDLVPKLPMLLSARDQLQAALGYLYTDPLTNFYRDILVDVIVETHVAGTTFFPTEKTIRPMLLGKSFLSFASVNYLAYLRQMGFRTFADFWSEDYDGYEGRERLIRMLAIIDEISSMTRSQQATMFWDMQYTLQHNRQLLSTQSWNNTITKI